MGVRTLQKTMAELELERLVDVGDEVAKCSTNIIVVDGPGLIRRLFHPKKFDWIRGGQWTAIFAFVAEFVEVFRKVGVELRVVWDGVSNPHKQRESRRRFRERWKDTKRAVVAALTKNFDSSKFRFCPPPSSTNSLKQAFELAGVTMVTAEGEGDRFLAAYAKHIGAAGVLAFDSDFIIYDVERYFVLETLSWGSDKRPQCAVLDNSALSSLGIPHSVAPLLACLIGNDYVDITDLHPFHTYITHQLKQLNLEETETKVPFVKEIIKFVQTSIAGDKPTVDCKQIQSTTNALGELNTLLQQRGDTHGCHFHVFEVIRNAGIMHHAVALCLTPRRTQSSNVKYDASNDTTEWVHSGWHTSIKAAKKAAAANFLQGLNTGRIDVPAKDTDTDYDSFLDDLPLEQRMVLQNVTECVHLSRAQSANLYRKVLLGMRQYRVELEDDALQGLSSIPLHPEYAQRSPSSLTTVPKILTQLHSRCKMRTRSIQVLSLGNSKVARAMEPASLSVCAELPSHYSTLFVRRICYGLLLATVLSDQDEDKEVNEKNTKDTEDDKVDYEEEHAPTTSPTTTTPPPTTPPSRTSLASSTIPTTTSLASTTTRRTTTTTTPPTTTTTTPPPTSTTLTSPTLTLTPTPTTSVVIRSQWEPAHGVFVTEMCGTVTSEDVNHGGVIEVETACRVPPLFIFHTDIDGDSIGSADNNTKSNNNNYNNNNNNSNNNSNSNSNNNSSNNNNNRNNNSNSKTKTNTNGIANDDDNNTNTNKSERVNSNSNNNTNNTTITIVATTTNNTNYSNNSDDNDVNVNDDGDVDSIDCNQPRQSHQHQQKYQQQQHHQQQQQGTKALSTIDMINGTNEFKCKVFIHVTCGNGTHASWHTAVASKCHNRDVMFCAMIRVLGLTGPKRLREDELKTMLLQHILLQRPGLGVELTNVLETSFPPINAASMQLAVKIAIGVDALLWTHELCGQPFSPHAENKTKATVADFHNGRLIHVIHAIVMTSSAPILLLLDDIERELYDLLWTAFSWMSCDERPPSFGIDDVTIALIDDTNDDEDDDDDDANNNNNVGVNNNNTTTKNNNTTINDDDNTNNNSGCDANELSSQTLARVCEVSPYVSSDTLTTFVDVCRDTFTPNTSGVDVSKVVVKEVVFEEEIKLYLTYKSFEYTPVLASSLTAQPQLSQLGVPTPQPTILLSSTTTSLSPTTSPSSPTTPKPTRTTTPTTAPPPTTTTPTTATTTTAPPTATTPITTPPLTTTAATPTQPPTMPPSPPLPTTTPTAPTTTTTTTTTTTSPPTEMTTTTAMPPPKKKKKRKRTLNRMSMIVTNEKTKADTETETEREGLLTSSMQHEDGAVDWKPTPPPPPPFDGPVNRTATVAVVRKGQDVVKTTGQNGQEHEFAKWFPEIVQVMQWTMTKSFTEVAFETYTCTVHIKQLSISVTGVECSTKKRAFTCVAEDALVRIAHEIAEAKMFDESIFGESTLLQKYAGYLKVEDNNLSVENNTQSVEGVKAAMLAGQNVRLQWFATASKSKSKAMVVPSRLYLNKLIQTKLDDDRRDWVNRVGRVCAMTTAATMAVTSIVFLIKRSRT